MAKMMKSILLISCLLLSTMGFARQFTVVNTAPYKMTIVAHFEGGGQQTWYCPRNQVCHLRHFPYQVRRVTISRYDNPNKFGNYPNRESYPHRPFDNKRIRCINHRHWIECYRVVPH